MPALLLELKWNRTADTAVSQIRNKRYTKALEEYCGDILLVGLSYDKKKTTHQCLIEKYKI